MCACLCLPSLPHTCVQITLSAGVPASPLPPLSATLKDVRTGGDSPSLEEVVFADAAPGPMPTQSKGPIRLSVFQSAEVRGV